MFIIIYLVAKSRKLQWWEVVTSAVRALETLHISKCVLIDDVVAQSLVGDNNILQVIIYFVPIAHKHIIAYIIFVLERFARNACALFYIIHIL